MNLILKPSCEEMSLAGIGPVDGKSRGEIALSEIRQDAQKQTAIELLHKGERFRLSKLFSHVFRIARVREKNQEGFSDLTQWY